LIYIQNVFHNVYLQRTSSFARVYPRSWSLVRSLRVRDGLCEAVL